eukprot:29695_3
MCSSPPTKLLLGKIWASLKLFLMLPLAICLARIVKARFTITSFTNMDTKTLSNMPPLATTSFPAWQ